MSGEDSAFAFRIDTLDARVQDGAVVPLTRQLTTTRPLENLSELDEYSRSFLDFLLQEYPDWRASAQLAEGEGGISLWLEITAPSPSFGSLWISTEDGQVTVGAGPYHAHFATYEPASDQDAFRQAMVFIGDLVAERMVLALAMKGDGYWCGWVQLPDSKVELPAFMPSDADQIAYRSWKGSLDRMIALKKG